MEQKWAAASQLLLKTVICFQVCSFRDKTSKVVKNVSIGQRAILTEQHIPNLEDQPF